MKKQIITGVICGGIGLLAGYKIATNKVMKLLNSEEFKQEIINNFKSEVTNMKGYSPIYDIILETREVAMTVIDNLNNLLNTYGTVSVADLYEICGLTCNYKDNGYGWTDVSSAKVEKSKNGYAIKIDSPVKFK